MQNSHSRCGCGGARVFECVDYPMPMARRLTLDDRDDRGRDWVQRERPEVELEFSDPTSGRDSKSDPISGRKKILSTATTRRRTRRKRTKDNETEPRRDERVLLDRVVDRLGGLSGWPFGRLVLDPPKTLRMSPGLARTQNRPNLNRICIEKYTDFDGRRIREFCPSRTRPDLLLFRLLGGTDFRVGFFASSFREFVSFRRRHFFG